MYRNILSKRALAVAATTAPAVSLITTLCGEKSAAKTANSVIIPQQQRAVQVFRRYLSDSPKTVSSTTTTPTATTTTTTTPPGSSVTSLQHRCSTTSATPPRPVRPTLLQWYESHLTANPVLTKMTTGSVLWSMGDAVAQIVPPMFASNSTTTTTFYNFQYDWQRTSRAALYGFAIHAPASHLHFNFLEWMTVRANVSGLGIPVFKAFMEQFVYWSWLSNAMYHGAMGAMQGQSSNQIEQHLRDVLWETQKAQWIFWIPIQLLNFRFVPVRHQLNVVLLTSVVWTALLSAWYPPVDQQQQLLSLEDGGVVVMEEQQQTHEKKFEDL